MISPRLVTMIIGWVLILTMDLRLRVVNDAWDWFYSHDTQQHCGSEIVTNVSFLERNYIILCSVHWLCEIRFFSMLYTTENWKC